MSNIPRLKRRLKALGITQDAVAREAMVTRPMVNHVLNRRFKSRRVIAAAERLLGGARIMPDHNAGAGSPGA